MTIVILGAGVQGTFYGIQFAQSGHNVTLVARGRRASELRTYGAAIRNAVTGQSDVMNLAVVERLEPGASADFCFVMVRREQIDSVLPDLKAATLVGRIIFMVNHANGSEGLFEALGRDRVVLGFPSVAGSINNGVVEYMVVAEQPTVLESTALDVAACVRSARLRVKTIADMDSWLKRHAVFVTAVGGALYCKNCDAGLLSHDRQLVRSLILAVREGWSALDRCGAEPANALLRTIFCWVPLPFAVAYWCRLLDSRRGEYYFARHTRHAITEMAALVSDLQPLMSGYETPHLLPLHRAINDRKALADGC
jgi:2-dehydropantoate 2-reductase